MLITPNPYRWDRVNPNLFYGRHSLVDEIVSDLNANHSSAVIGGRKMGKTTLLRKIEDELSSMVPSSMVNGIVTLPVYVDTLRLPHPLNALRIYSAIVRQIERKLGSLDLIESAYVSLTPIFEDYPNEENRAFGQILKRLVKTVEARCFLQIAALLDEIEPITRAEWGEGFFSNWRNLLSNDLELSSHVSAVFCGAKEMAMIARDIGSPLANILSWHELSLFSNRDSERLVNEPSGGVLPASIAKSIFTLSGGHPFLIQYLMHHICKFSIDEATLKLNEARDQFLNNHRNQFHNWWFEKFCDEDKRVYEYLASQRRTILKREVIRLVGDLAANKSLATLCHTGVVRKSQHERYTAAGSMFKKWFQVHGTVTAEHSNFDAGIYKSLGLLDQEIANKYVSAWSIQALEVPNYSGAVSEIRDVVTLVLHKLAPDKVVKSQANYVPDKDKGGVPLDNPTRAQRVRFVMQTKGVSDANVIDAEIRLLETLGEQLSQVVRGGYERASARTHKTATRDQAWKCLKQLDSILAQLL